MEYRWFIFILMAGAVLSVTLLAAKIFLLHLRGFRGRLSWCAIPLPFCVAWIAVSYDWIWLRIIWNQ